MRILFDTNIILDVLLARKPFVETSSALVGLVECKQINGYLCATTITTLDYLISKATNRHRAKSEIKKLLAIFSIADVNAGVLEMAIASSFTDFEDAVQFYAAKLKGANGLVTRNNKDYKNTTLPVYTPEELLGIMMTLNKQEP